MPLNDRKQLFSRSCAPCTPCAATGHKAARVHSIARALVGRRPKVAINIFWHAPRAPLGPLEPTWRKMCGPPRGHQLGTRPAACTPATNRLGARPWVLGGGQVGTILGVCATRAPMGLRNRDGEGGGPWLAPVVRVTARATKRWCELCGISIVGFTPPRASHMAYDSSSC